MQNTTATEPVDAMPEPGWHWWNCRSFAVGLHIWLWPMAFGRYVTEDVYGGERHIYLGPLHLSISYDVGNCSAEQWRERAGGLSQSEAYDRALRYEGRR